MANTITTDDLKAYALWLAGEPTDGSSDYDERILQHMQLVYNTFVNGGTIGVRDVAQAAGLYEHLVDIPTTDWYWLRKQPPFAFVTTPALLGVASGVTLNQGTVLGTVTLTYGSPTIAFSVAPAISVTGFRLKLLQQAQGVPNPPITVPRIAAHTAAALTAQLDAPWNQESQTVSSFVLFQAEYPLPADFVRFVEAWQVQGGWTGGNPPRLNVGSYEKVNDQTPLTEYNQGPPSAAARLDTNTIMMNRWDTYSYRIEGSYIFQPETLAIDVEQQPLLPLRFRHALSVGAAMMVMQDKVDGRKNDLASELREIIHHMGIEYRHEQQMGSEWAGRHLYRQGQTRRSMLRTTSGLPLF
jgi:hypothetical protein